MRLIINFWNYLSLVNIILNLTFPGSLMSLIHYLPPPSSPPLFSPSPWGSPHPSPFPLYPFPFLTPNWIPRPPGACLCPRNSSLSHNSNKKEAWLINLIHTNPHLPASQISFISKYIEYTQYQTEQNPNTFYCRVVYQF